MIKTIAVDIGHGEDTFDKGGKGVKVDGKAYEEHHFNSKVAIKLKTLLELSGFKVIFGQEPFKSDVPLLTRTNLYNKLKVDLVWSIHANAGRPEARGLSAFYWHTADDSKKLATIYVDEVKKAGYPLHGNGLHPSIPDTWTNLHICRETDMTAVLTENGFMTNKDDFELIFGSKSAEFIDRVALIHYKSICRYYGVTPKEPIAAPVEPPKKVIESTPPPKDPTIELRAQIIKLNSEIARLKSEAITLNTQIAKANVENTRLGNLLKEMTEERNGFKQALMSMDEILHKNL